MFKHTPVYLPNIFELYLIPVCYEQVREDNCTVMFTYVIFRTVSDHDICWLVEKENWTKGGLSFLKHFIFLLGAQGTTSSL